MKFKRLACFLTIIVMMAGLWSCAKQPKQDVTLLEFPGLKWNATPNEVKKALNLTDNQIVVDEQVKLDPSIGYDAWCIRVSDYTVFGSEVPHLRFFFVKYPGYAEYGLENITLNFAEDTDMTNIKEKLIAIYGSGDENTIIYSDIRDGKVVNKKMKVKSGSSVEMAHGWVSTAKGTEMLTTAAKEAIVEMFTKSNSNNPATREVVTEWLETNPLVSILLTDKVQENDTIDPYYTSNKVQFSANH